MNCVLILVSITVCVHELVHNFFKCHYENFLLHCTARLKFFFGILQKIEVLESLESFRKEGDQYKVGSWEIKVIVNRTGNKDTYFKKVIRRN